MKVVIGITQSIEEVEKNICKKFKRSTISTEVGPFRSSEDASLWMQFMMARAKGYEQVTIPLEPSVDTPWYGFVFEGVESKSINP